MVLVGNSDVATSILVIPCDKQPLYQLNVKPIPDGKLPILYGNFTKQYVVARKCICGETPCKGIITTDWDDVQQSSYVPMGDTFDVHKKNVQVAEELFSRSDGNVSMILEAIQEYSILNS